MPTIYDNIEEKLLEGLGEGLRLCRRGDFCVGYFNLRGWSRIARDIDSIVPEEGEPACRLIVGMSSDTDTRVRQHYSNTETKMTHRVVYEAQKEFAASARKQLTYGAPTKGQQRDLLKLKEQLRSRRLQVKFFGRYQLHAKLYLIHRGDALNPITGYVGSSNLTLAGLEKQGELNVDVQDKDAAKKLALWFEDRWEDDWCLDITEDLADIIEESWANGPVKPYEIYIKTAYELSREAIQGAQSFTVPKEFRKIMLEFQMQAVSLAVKRLNGPHRGVIVGDVVGLGKTLVASAIAKTLQEDRGHNVLVICPPKLEAMWDHYMDKYHIAGNTLSLGKVKGLANRRRYRLIIIDESHNLRNRDGVQYGYVRDYIRDNESHVVLLTATPYNMHFSDIGSQLRLFLDPDADLNIRPDEYIKALGGATEFGHEHPNAPIFSLDAFEKSTEPDDWRELMRMFMVRRTREHIKRNYAQYDEERKQSYLTFSDKQRYYFPDRVPKCAKFAIDDKDRHDQYALLYSSQVVDAISNLRLPRYGIAKYLLPEYADFAKRRDFTKNQKRIMKNLSRAGRGLLGFAKAGLFKRLESSGPAFLISIRRHIMRNAVYIYAMEEEEGKFPIGDVFGSLADESMDESETNAVFDERPIDHDMEHFLNTARNIYKQLTKDDKLRNKFDWVKSNLFDQSLREDLQIDCFALLKILNMVPQWHSDADRKLEALLKLCQETHPQEKLLIFTQFKDTADYLRQELGNRGVTQIEEVFGNMDNISKYVQRFSPNSNKEISTNIDKAEPIRVLITTDTLSEGQNLQDAHIIVNFDLPWAIIRLVQRAGRVDRIGQTARQIFCYCFLPEEGIENIIDLRGRLNRRMQENAELVGSDEVFFEGDRADLSRIYAENLVLEEEEDETDLISRAYDIWRQAIKQNPALENKIKTMPDVVYSSKQAQNNNDGVLAYIKTSTGQPVLAQVNKKKEVISQSQYKILSMMECPPNEPTAETATNHHELVRQAISHVKANHSSMVGQLGGKRSIRKRLYERLQVHLEKTPGTEFHISNLKKAIEHIYRYPLKDTARDRLARQLHMHITDSDLATMITTLWESDDLVIIPKENAPVETHIICSMGLVK